jgi:phosphatidylserine decarboxylase
MIVQKNQAAPEHTMLHHYVERNSRAVRQERFRGHRVIPFIYSRVRENSPLLFRLLTSRRISSLVAFLSFNEFINEKLTDPHRFMRETGVDARECLDLSVSLNTPKKIFERRIRYWDCRLMPHDPAAVVSPADSRMLVGSFDDSSSLFLKGKFFDYEELLGVNRDLWLKAFRGGDYAVFRLTPDKYHYNHTPVAGIVRDHYEIDGRYHACHPAAVVSMITPYSKNKRVVTIIDTDVPGGTGLGLVAMVEVVAMMIGDIAQCYSESQYDRPIFLYDGLFMKKGQPKSLFRPGSSTVVLMFQKDRIRFSEDIVWNMSRPDAASIFSRGFDQPLVETEVALRSLIGTARIRKPND